MNKHLSTIRRASNVGLWSAVAVVIVAALFHTASHYSFHQTHHTQLIMTVCAAVLTVVAVSMALYSTRKHIPQLRQSTNLQAKLGGYATHVKQVFATNAVVAVLVSCLSVLSAQNALLMLAIVAVLTLFLSYPNMYRIKGDLGLGDDEMRTLFGDKYITDNEQ